MQGFSWEGTPAVAEFSTESMTVAAVNAIVARMMFVAELHGLARGKYFGA